VDNKNIQGINGQQSPITLMIDIKSDAHKTFAALSLLLDKYKTILSAYENGRVRLREVTVVITGNKPIELIKEKQNRLVFLDQDLRQVGVGTSANTSPIASCKYSRILKWKGKGPINPEEKQRLCDFVNKAHQNGCKVRLWASPENAVVWDELLRCNVDLINTNKLSKLRDFLVSENLSLANTGSVILENMFPGIVSK
jgi:hypothetical protein